VRSLFPSKGVGRRALPAHSRHTDVDVPTRISVRPLTNSTPLSMSCCAPFRVIGRITFTGVFIKIDDQFAFDSLKAVVLPALHMFSRVYICTRTNVHTCVGTQSVPDERKRHTQDTYRTVDMLLCCVVLCCVVLRT